MSPNEKAQAIVRKMYDADEYSRRLGMEIIRVDAGLCQLSLSVTQDMLNGHGIAHGGITYALADSCLAFASNSRGIEAVSVETSISHTRPVKVGDVLTAVNEELQLGKTFGRYTIRVGNQKKEQVAIFHGTVFRNGNAWEV